MKAILGVFRVIQEELVEFIGFVGINVIFGAMAIWLPVALALFFPFASPKDEFLSGLAEGNGCLFGLAILTGASSYLVREYRSSKQSEFKSAKTISAFVAIILSALMSITIGALSVTRFFDAQHANLPANSRSNTGLISLQISLTLLSFLMSLYFFCLERIDDYPEYGKGLRDKKSKALIASMEANSSTGIKL